MKSLIIYSSKSGNTKTLADAVESLLPGEKICKSVEEKPAVDGFDLLCIGFWFKAGKAEPKAAELLEALNTRAPLFLFATHGAAVDSDHARNGIKQAEELAAPCRVIGTFNCQGEVNQELLAKTARMDQPPPWIKDAPKAVGHPDDRDIRGLAESLQRAVNSL